MPETTPAAPVSMTLKALAEQLGADLHGDGDQIITGVSGIEEAQPGDVTFVANPKYVPAAKTTNATAVLVEPDFAEIATATLRLKNPYLAFAKAINIFRRSPVYPPGIHPTAVVADTAVFGANAHVGAFAVISDHVVIGNDAVILPHVVLYPHVRAGDRLLAHAHAVVREHCVLGDDVILQNGVILGADGFGFARQDGKEFAGRAWYKIQQTGPVVIEDFVEVQANACIDRASVGETRIGAGTKVDNLVQVGHGSIIGRDTLLCAQVGLAGSTTVGNNVILAGQVGVVGHSVISDNVVVTAQSGVPGDVPAGSVVSGTPAFDNRKWLRSVAIFNRLPEIVRQLKTKGE